MDGEPWRGHHQRWLRNSTKAVNLEPGTRQGGNPRKPFETRSQAYTGTVGNTGTVGITSIAHPHPSLITLWHLGFCAHVFGAPCPAKKCIYNHITEHIDIRVYTIYLSRSLSLSLSNSFATYACFEALIRSPRPASGRPASASLGAGLDRSAGTPTPDFRALFLPLLRLKGCGRIQRELPILD